MLAIEPTQWVDSKQRLYRMLSEGHCWVPAQKIKQYKTNRRFLQVSCRGSCQGYDAGRTLLRLWSKKLTSFCHCRLMEAADVMYRLHPPLVGCRKEGANDVNMVPAWCTVRAFKAWRYSKSRCPSYDIFLRGLPVGCMFLSTAPITDQYNAQLAGHLNKVQNMQEQS